MSTFVVTGSSTGIGAACTLRLAGAGHRVIAGVRRVEDGERLAAQHGRLDELEARMPDEAHELYADAIDEIRGQIDGQERTGVAADRVAAVVERAPTSRWPRYRYLVGADAKAAGLLERFLPDRAMAFVARRLGP